jgi:hypothetical protein
MPVAKAEPTIPSMNVMPQEVNAALPLLQYVHLERKPVVA